MAGLGNVRLAARLFADLLTRYRCPATVWIDAATAWMEDDNPQRYRSKMRRLLERMHAAAKTATPPLKQRLDWLWGRLRAPLVLGLPVGRRPPKGMFNVWSGGGANFAPRAGLAPRGKMRSILQVDAPIWASPLLGHDSIGRPVIFLADTKGRLIAVRPSGSVWWKKNLGEPILVGLAGAGRKLAGMSAKHIFVMDAANGRVLAKMKRPKGCGGIHAVEGHMELACNRVRYRLTTSGLQVVDRLPSACTAGPVATVKGCVTMGLDNGRVVAACRGSTTLRSVEACNGPVVGLVGMKSGAWVASCSNGVLTAFEKNRILWRARLPGRPTNVIGFHTNGFVVGIRAGGLVLVTRTGLSKALPAVDAPVVATPLTNAAGGILFGARDGRIRRWDKNTGGPSWSVTVGSDIDTSPLALDDGSVVVATTDGRLLLMK